MKVPRLCLLIAALFAGCDTQPDVPIGNGFVLRPHGTSGELHPDKISLYLKAGKQEKLVWPSLNSSCGGPILLEKGILFTARNEASKDAIFAADERGVVVDISPFIKREMSRESEIRQIKDTGDMVKFDMWDDSGRPVSKRLQKSALMQNALTQIKNGRTIKWGNQEFYR